MEGYEGFNGSMIVRRDDVLIRIEGMCDGIIPSGRIILNSPSATSHGYSLRESTYDPKSA